ncbi:hypothetical protein ACI79C_00215 [Geodermatophilus sp. SYSU D00697]
MRGDVGEVLLFWPAVAVLGFVALAAVVIVLGVSSTARYQFERNQVQQQRAVPARSGSAPARTGAASRPGADGPRADAGTGGGAAAPAGRREHGAAVGVATHPAGKRAVGPGTAAAWWLVDGWGEGPGERVVAGPFADRIDADWAALSADLSASVVAVHGVQRADGALVRRQLPQDRAWLSELGEQLDRLAEEWTELMSDDDALTTLVVEVTAALVEAGLPLHDCDGQGAAGGVCLTPVPGSGGILVSWHQHDRMSRQQVRGATMDAAVQRTMNAAVADLLAQMGFGVDASGSAGCPLVTAARG